MTDLILTKFREKFPVLYDEDNKISGKEVIYMATNKDIEDFLTEALIQVRKETLSEVEKKLKLIKPLEESENFYFATGYNSAINDTKSLLEELKTK